MKKWVIFDKTLAGEDASGCPIGSRNYAAYSGFFFYPLTELWTYIVFDALAY